MKYTMTKQKIDPILTATIIETVNREDVEKENYDRLSLPYTVPKHTINPFRHLWREVINLASI